MQAEHKIQSSDSHSLHLTLQKVPKMIGALRTEWAPHAMVVSFKLETDETLLEKKARNSIQLYNVHMVIASMLHTRNDRVYLVTASSTVQLDRPENEPVIEKCLIEKVVEAHQHHIAIGQIELNRS